MLDPSCGDGRFLAAHRPCVGVEQDPASHRIACERAPWALIHEGDFFAWADATAERFECASGNPPFIRFHHFTGHTRQRALDLCGRHGVRFSGLASSWAPFLVATASLLKPGGRLAFVVPAEIGHAPYAAPLLKYLLDNFRQVRLVAVREKLFAELSEDVWLLFADGFGDNAGAIELSALEKFVFQSEPPDPVCIVSRADWESWGFRLRPFLLPENVRKLYRDLVEDGRGVRFGEVARIGIGYVTGDNSFFHLKPSEARAAGIPRSLLKPSVRNGRKLSGRSLTKAQLQQWLDADEECLLLHVGRDAVVPKSVERYLSSPAAREASGSYKCRTRSPWYSVPDVKVPDAFLAYLSSRRPNVVANAAGCVGTNSVHTINVTGGWSLRRIQRAWDGIVTELSCEVEGHPLGGGALKIEPGEAARIVLVDKVTLSPTEGERLARGVVEMRRWRHADGGETD